jgi:fatty acid desaturase
VAGTSCGALLLFPWGTFRAYHIEHHASTTTENDPEGVPVAFGSRLELCLLPLGGLYTLGQLGWYTGRTLVGRPPRWIRTRAQKRDVWLSTVTVVAFAALLVLGFSAAPELVVRGWLVPYAVAIFVSYPLIFLPEHSYGAPGDTLDHTRTTVSNRFLGWIYWNNNFHAVHHLVPTAVHQHIRELSDDIHPYQTDEWWIPGYCRFIWSLWRSLPTFPSRGAAGDVIDLTDH